MIQQISCLLCCLCGSLISDVNTTLSGLYTQMNLFAPFMFLPWNLLNSEQILLYYFLNCPNSWNSLGTSSGIILFRKNETRKSVTFLMNDPASCCLLCCLCIHRRIYWNLSCLCLEIYWTVKKYTYIIFQNCPNDMLNSTIPLRHPCLLASLWMVQIVEIH